MKKLEDYMKVASIAALFCLLGYVAYVETVNDNCQQKNKIEYIEEQNIFKISRCKSVGRLAAEIAHNVVNKVPLSDVLDPGDKGDSLYIKTKAYSSIMLRLGETKYITEFQTDMIVDCLTGKMDG